MKHYTPASFVVVQPSLNLGYRLTRWSLTQALRASWALARLSDRVGDTSLALDTWINRKARQCNVEMVDVLEPLGG